MKKRLCSAFAADSPPSPPLHWPHPIATEEL